ncbi:Peptidase aspartic protein [Lasiodiplodia theobromae]|uniref:Peptidase aspartic protein n=1 Tax=Lasiodiplodia theobromae TaxID=45133 RepID=UPI0015C2FD12|nr:Peptidase aspartic protein [Lasiodiplodia theobromae]KAF4535028.1 Peptidase aspartic protein [Lasiodiplodia theobromae]
MTANPTPTPYLAPPTQEWDGMDGNWSTFRISIGSMPSQNFRVLVSTRAGLLWVPSPKAYWDDLSIYNLGLEDRLYPKHGNGDYGFDRVRLGFGDNTDALEVNKTLAVTYGDDDYWLGLLGIGEVNTTLQEGKQPIPSFIRDLNDTTRIPSISYGYTAGAYYRNTKVPGSLVIGGYDQSRSQPSKHNFSISQDTQQSLSVAIQAIGTNSSLSDPGPRRLLTNGHSSIIDSTVSQLWLPEDVCNNFATAFGLTYDAKKNYYLINETIHDILVEQKPTITMRVGKPGDTDTKNGIQIDLPYAAFDHYIGFPAYQDTRRYFPIRQAKNSTQYTIGRVFLQEAYLTVDYESSTFTLAQARFEDPMPDRDIRTIHSKNYVPPSRPSSSLSVAAKAGIAIGVIVSFILAIGIVYLYCWRPRREKKTHKKRPSIASQAPTYQSSAEPPPHYYREAKPYDPWATMPQEQHAEHGRQHHQHSVSEMPAGADGQERRPELDGSGVGGGSYELAAPMKEREEDIEVHEMGVDHKSEVTVSQDHGRVMGEEGESNASEQRPAGRRMSSFTLPSPP